jgi:hypothetical protein
MRYVFIKFMRSQVFMICLKRVNEEHDVISA